MTEYEIEIGHHRLSLGSKIVAPALNEAPAVPGEQWDILPGVYSVDRLVVLNLPMTGPLLLQASISQDMYLAGSFIMMLSVLTVIGTLLSDLLLAWLDPRIRYS